MSVGFFISPVFKVNIVFVEYTNPMLAGKAVHMTRALWRKKTDMAYLSKIWQQMSWIKQDVMQIRHKHKL